MGRPKLYVSPEEKVLAARRYRAKYYAKNRTTINRNRAEKRKETGDTKECQAIQPIGEPSSKNPELTRRPGRPKGMKNHVPVRACEPVDSESNIETCLKGIIGHSSRQRIQALCEDFIASMNYKDIYDTLSAVEELEKRLRKLTLSTDALPTSALQKATRAVIRGLEDLLMNAMEGANMSELMHKGMLVYQVAPDITL